MFTSISIVALFASLAAAQHAPVGATPSGNPIAHPGLNEFVPLCKPYTITWTPTTPNTVSLLLLKGPSNNVVPYGPPIVVGIPNSGSYTFTFPASIDASTAANGYGIQLIDDVNGQYQYSTQFGFSKDAACAVVASSSVKSTAASSSGYPVSTPAKSSSYAASTPMTTMTTSCSTSAMYPISNSTAVHSSAVVSTYVPVYPTATVNATTSRLPQATGAASALQAGVGLAGAVVAFAFML